MMQRSSKDCPLVSVIMPVYNHQNYVGEAIQSVYLQSYRPLELIIIDDGSSDESAEVVRRHMDACAPPDGITVDFRSRARRGAHATINEGLDYASGDYLTIINSDDLYVSERVEKCLKAAKSHRALLVLSYVEPINENGFRVAADHRWCQWYNTLVLQELDTAPSLSVLLLSNNIGVSTGNFFFDRKLLDEIGYFKPYKYTHDLDFLLRASRVQEPVLVREKLYKYRLHHSNTITAVSAETELEYAAIIKDYLVASLTGAKNPLAPEFINWPNVMGNLASSQSRLTKALESFIELPPPALDVTKPVVRGKSNGRKVTIVTHEMTQTGAPMIAFECAKLLASAGFKVNVITQRDGPLTGEFVSAGIPVKTLFPGHLKQRSRTQWRRSRTLGRLALGAMMGVLVRFAPGILQALRNLNPHKKEVLLINSFAAFPLASEILRTWQGRTFWYIHETYDPAILLSGRDQERLERLKTRISFLYGSEATRQVWAREGFDGQLCYWSGLPAFLAELNTKRSRRRQRKGDKIRILSVGTSGPRKGTRVLIEAFAYACRNNLIPPQAELIIVAVLGPAENAQTRDFILQTLRPEICGRVRLVGVANPNALYSYYEEADLYVQASTMECLPLAILNAMAYGLPIITTDVDGCKEAIIDGVCGITVPPRQIEMLATAIGKLLSSPAKARQYGEAARRRFVDKFSLEVTGRAMLKVLTRDETEGSGVERSSQIPATAPTHAGNSRVVAT